MEDNYKLKLYNEGAPHSLEKVVKVLSLKEATKRELQESKPVEIESVTPRGSCPDSITDQDTEQRNQRDSKRRPFQTSGRNWALKPATSLGRRNCPAAETRYTKCNKMGHFSTVSKSVPIKKMNHVLKTEDDFSSTFVGEVITPTRFNTSTAEPATNPEGGRPNTGWHVPSQDPRPRHADMVH